MPARERFWGSRRPRADGNDKCAARNVSVIPAHFLTDRIGTLGVGDPLLILRLPEAGRRIEPFGADPDDRDERWDGAL